MSKRAAQAAQAPGNGEETIRAEVAAYVAAQPAGAGLNTVARALGVSRTGLSSYLAGSSHRGTALLIETVWRMHREGKVKLRTADPRSASMRDHKG